MKTEQLKQRFRLMTISLLVMMILFTWSVAGFAKSDGGVFQFAGDMTIPEEKVVNGNVDSLAGNINIYGTVNGNVTALAGNVTVFGKVNGNIQCLAGNIYVKKSGEVTGDVTASAGQVYEDDTARIGGTVTQILGREGEGTYYSWDWDRLSNFNFHIPWYFLFWGAITGLIAVLALGAVLMLFFSEQVLRLSDHMKARPVYYFFVGLVGLLLTPFACILLLITVIAIPLIPVLLILVMFGIFIGQLGMARYIGDRVKDRLGFSYETEMARTMVGILIIFFVSLIPVVGWIFFFITVCIGFGNALINRFGVQKKEKKEKKEDPKEIDMVDTEVITEEELEESEDEHDDKDA